MISWFNRSGSNRAWVHLVKLNSGGQVGLDGFLPLISEVIIDKLHSVGLSLSNITLISYYYIKLLTTSNGHSGNCKFSTSTSSSFFSPRGCCYAVFFFPPLRVTVNLSIFLHAVFPKHCLSQQATDNTGSLLLAMSFKRSHASPAWWISPSEALRVNVKSLVLLSNWAWQLGTNKSCYATDKQISKKQIQRRSFSEYKMSQG